MVDCTGEIPLILRRGAVTFEQLREIVPEIEVYQLKANETPKSPGLKHRHYAPKAKVLLFNPKSKIPNPKSEVAFIGLDAPSNADEFVLVKVCATIEIYAHELFRFFRECDEKGVAQIFCQTVEEKGLGSALMDRLRRASEAEKT